MSKANRTRRVLLVALLACAAYALAQQGQQPQTRTIEFEPITEQMLLDPDPADWIMWRRNYASWGYSPLDQINRDNVGDLELAWAWAMIDRKSTRLNSSHVKFSY